MDNIKLENHQNKCRLCFKTPKRNVDRIEIDKNVIDIISVLTEIELISHQNFSNFICRKCHKPIIKFFMFREELIKKQQKFLDFISAESSKTIEYIKVEAEEYNVGVIKVEYDEIPEGTIIEFKNQALKETNFNPNFESLSNKQEKEKIDASLEEKDVKHKIEDNKEIFQINKNDKNINCAMTHNDAKIQKSDNELKKKKKSTSHTKFIICEICGKPFGRKKFREHVDAVHLKIRRYHCDVCPMNFYRKAAIVDHVTTHIPEEFRVRKYQCDLCIKTYLTKNAIRTHIRGYHSTGPEPCNFCGKICSNKALRLNHERNVHRSNSTECKICKKVFSSQSIKNHMSIHNTDNMKKFQCDVCGKSFNIKYKLTKHKKIHAERKVCCDFPGCGKKFIHASYLKIHKQFHTSERSFSCSYPDCNKSYFSNMNLQKHIFIFHKKIKEKCPVGNGCMFSVGRIDYMRNHLKHHSELKPDELKNYIKGLKNMNLI